MKINTSFLVLYEYMRFFKWVIFVGVFFLILFMSRYSLESFFLTKRLNYQFEISKSMSSLVKFADYAQVNEYSLNQAKLLYRNDPSMEHLLKYARQLVYVGELDQGLDLLEKQLKVPEFRSYNKKNQLRLYVLLLEGYFKKSELEHCFKRYSPYACILPLNDTSLQHNKIFFDRILELILAVKALNMDLNMLWLEDLSKHLIGQKSLTNYFNESVEHSSKFKPVAGIFSADGLAGGAVVDDFNNDGLLDIVTSSINGKLQLFYRQKTEASKMRPLNLT